MQFDNRVGLAAEDDGESGKCKKQNKKKKKKQVRKIVQPFTHNYLPCYTLLIFLLVTILLSCSPSSSTAPAPIFCFLDACFSQRVAGLSEGA